MTRRPAPRDPQDRDRPGTSGAAHRLTVAQNATGYWAVRRGTTHLTGALTRTSAEGERQLLEGLGERAARRATTRRIGEHHRRRA